MLFSFIIPVYNSKAYLTDCVVSLQKINAPNVSCEIVLIDDGSTDGSSQTCDELAANAARHVIKVYHTENKGVSAARNKGLRMATGDYVIFMDSDDTVEAEKLGGVLEQISVTPRIDVGVYGISFDYWLMGKCYRKDVVIPPYSGIVERETWMQQPQKLFEANVLSAIWNKIIRREILIAHGLSLRDDMIILEDLEFSLRVMGKCNNVLFFPEPVYHYVHMGNEDNAAKRVKRLKSISEVPDKLEPAIGAFLDGEDSGNLQMQKNNVLLSVYQNLLGDGVRLFSVREIREACQDFGFWIDRKGLLELISGKPSMMRYYEEKTLEIYLRSRYSVLRHRLANWVKLHVGDFRKWFR